MRSNEWVIKVFSGSAGKIGTGAARMGNRVYNAGNLLQALITVY